MSLGGRLSQELPPGVLVERAEIGGRVVLCEPGGFLLELAGERVRVAAGDSVELGAIVIARGRWDGATLTASSVAVAQLPARPFGRADSDWAAGQTSVPMLLKRHALMRAVRSFFDDAGFTEVSTPSIVRNPGQELQLEAFEVLGAGGPRWLHTSPEYHMKRLLSAGLPRIYQLCHAFRRAERGTRHEPEFMMLEWYRAFSDSDALMRDTEQLVAHGARALCGSTRVQTSHGQLDVEPPWERITVRDAFARIAGRDIDALLADEELFFRVLVEEIEPELGKGKPAFLTHYPASMAALARLRADDPRSADRFEAYAFGVELCNGFGELTDPVEQRKRFEAELAERKRMSRTIYPIDERFLAALEDGIPPSGGNALGFDRLLMLLAGAGRIADVMAFPVERA